MSGSPEVLAAFEAWKLAELAAHYAEPCPDEVMNMLVGRASDASDALHAIEPTSADDMVLKLFTLLLRDWEPSVGGHPMRPHGDDAEFVTRLIAQLGATSPALAAAMAEPWPGRRRRAA